MITANTKVTAVEILKELGIKNAENVFGKMRVRIGGIAGINAADKVINLPPETKTVEVIVGNELYELELAKGREDITDVTEGARAALDAEGVEATKQSEKLQAVKELARKIREAQDAGEEYEPTKAEEKILDQAVERVDAEREAKAAATTGANRKPIKVKSK